RDFHVTGVQTCALPISRTSTPGPAAHCPLSSRRCDPRGVAAAGASPGLIPGEMPGAAGPSRTRNGPGANPPRPTPGPPRREHHHDTHLAPADPPARLSLLRGQWGDAARYALPAVQGHRAVPELHPMTA